MKYLLAALVCAACLVPAEVEAGWFRFRLFPRRVTVTRTRQHVKTPTGYTTTVTRTKTVDQSGSWTDPKLQPAPKPSQPTGKYRRECRNGRCYLVPISYTSVRTVPPGNVSPPSGATHRYRAGGLTFDLPPIM